jgi:hypothetical protein
MNIVLVLLPVLLGLQACGYREATYFRKHEATLEDERRDWGLCGGNFYPSGRLIPVISPPVLKCMHEKGYLTMNDYYEEDHIAFIDSKNPEETLISEDDRNACGIKNTGRDSICWIQNYIVKDTLPNVIKCMRRRGFEPALPKNKSGYRLIDNERTLSKLYCLTLSPKNKKGGISLFQWRVE